MSPYLEALKTIPCGQTRSFLELAALAGRPGAARAAGRAVRSASASDLPCHRVVSSSQRPDETQLRRLRSEGARPRRGESIQDWARRIGARFIGVYGTRHFAPPDDEHVAAWHPERVEAFADETSALSRGFAPIGANAPGEVPLPTKRCVDATPGLPTFRERLAAVDWPACRDRLVTDGVFRIPNLLAPSECASILNKSTRLERFERTIQMLPKGYGVGTYHYYREPIPEPAGALREHLYRELAPDGYPARLEDFWQRCREAGQKRASSILIGYGKGGINHPHRDIYGRVWFPFQALLMLSKRGRDFAGGAFYVADEDLARSERVVPVSEGDVAVFATRDRFENGRKIAMRHGMKMLTRGTRYGLGIVFHLAE